MVEEGDKPAEITAEEIKPFTGEKDCNHCDGQRFLYHDEIFWISQDESIRLLSWRDRA